MIITAKHVMLPFKQHIPERLTGSNTHANTHTRAHACTHAQARAHTFHGGAVLSGIRAPLLEGQYLPLFLGKLLSS